MRGRFCANCFLGGSMDKKAISPVVSMMLILAIITTSISVLWANYVPIVKKRAEIEHNEKLIDEFLSISTIYSLLNENESKVISLKLGGGETTFGRLTTSSTLKVRNTGTVIVDMSCDNSTVRKSFSLFGIELSIHNTYLPNRAFVFSEGGIKVFQYDKNITRLEPNINESLRFQNDTLMLRIDNLKTDPQEVSGNGIVYLRLKFECHSDRYYNCTGFIQVNDSLFEDEWIGVMKSLSKRTDRLSFDSENDSLEFNNINVSILIRNFVVNIN